MPKDSTKNTGNEAALYGTAISNVKLRSNHPIRSRYMAAALALVFGVIGVNQFYLRNIIRGILKILLTLVFAAAAYIFNKDALMLIPFVISALTCVIYLCQSDEKFQKKNRVRTV